MPIFIHFKRTHFFFKFFSLYPKIEDIQHGLKLLRIRTKKLKNYANIFTVT